MPICVSFLCVGKLSMVHPLPELQDINSIAAIDMQSRPGTELT